MLSARTFGAPSCAWATTTSDQAPYVLKAKGGCSWRDEVVRGGKAQAEATSERNKDAPTSAPLAYLGSTGGPQHHRHSSYIHSFEYIFTHTRMLN
jgi:hypothetical protein